MYLFYNHFWENLIACKAVCLSWDNELLGDVEFATKINAILQAMNMHEIQKKKKTKQNKTIKVKIKSLSDSVSVINLPVSECLRKKLTSEARVIFDLTVMANRDL